MVESRDPLYRISSRLKEFGNAISEETVKDVIDAIYLEDMVIISAEDYDDAQYGKYTNSYGWLDIRSIF